MGSSPVKWHRQRGASPASRTLLSPPTQGQQAHPASHQVPDSPCLRQWKKSRELCFKASETLHRAGGGSVGNSQDSWLCTKQVGAIPIL